MKYRSTSVGTREDLLVKSQDLTPGIHSRADETEKLRHVPQVTVDELRAAGLNRVLQPSVYGGAEAPFAGLIDVVSTIASACASTGWVLAQYTIHNFMVAQFPPETQEAIWGEKPEALVCGVLIPGCGKAVPVDGGWRLSGRWPFASGVTAADWCILSGFEESETRDSLMFAIPCEKITVHDTWHTMGLSGTGSNDVSVEDLFVSSDRAMSVDQSKFGESPGTQVNSGPLYRLGTFAMFSVVQSATAYGHAKGTFDRFLKHTRERTGRLSGQRVIDYGTTQIKIGEAAASLDAAELILHACADEAMEVASRGDVMDIIDKCRMRGDATFAGNLAARAVDIMFSLAGGAALYDSHPLSRAYRDAKCAQAHITQNWDINGSNYGRVLVGLPTLDTNI